MICTSIEGKYKLIAPKLNSFLMHVGCQKCKVSMLGVYMNMNYVHSRMKGNALLVKDLLS